jgi:hypothetical protein
MLDIVSHLCSRTEMHVVDDEVDSILHVQLNNSKLNY